MRGSLASLLVLHHTLGREEWESLGKEHPHPSSGIPWPCTEHAMEHFSNPIAAAREAWRKESPKIMPATA